MLTRLQRGAARATAHAEITIVRLNRKLMGFRPQATALLRHSAFTALAISVATSPVTVHATEAGAGSVDDEPSSITASASPLSQVNFEPLATASLLATPIVVPLALAVITPGESIQDVQEKQAAEAEAQAKAVKIQEEAEKASRLAAEKKAREEVATRVAQQAAQQARAAKPDTAQSSSYPTEYDTFFQKYFGDVWLVAKAICTAESGLNPTSISRTGDYGLCQINRVHKNRVSGDLSRLFDPETNIRIAADIYRDNGGWHPWTVFRTGAYKRYLAR